jgi:hypothetical protein
MEEMAKTLVVIGIPPPVVRVVNIRVVVVVVVNTTLVV